MTACRARVVHRETGALAGTPQNRPASQDVRRARFRVKDFRGVSVLMDRAGPARPGPLPRRRRACVSERLQDRGRAFHGRGAVLRGGTRTERRGFIPANGALYPREQDALSA